MSGKSFEGRIRHLLVVEDSAILAMDLELSGGEMGLDRVTVVPDAAGAMAVIDAGDVDAALVDFFLGQDVGRRVAERLRALDIPFALMTGFGDLDWLREQVPGAPILTKPFSTDELAETLDQLC